jgi:putative phosphoribosyl transferase
MFRDRKEAGERLAARLSRLRRENPLVLALPRGGVPVAHAVADALDADLDVCLVRKLSVPWQPELALGALAEGGVRVLDQALVKECRLGPRDIEPMTEQAQAEIDRRGRLYRGSRAPANVRGRRVIVVDDGLATGSTMIAAVRALRARGAERIVVAVPVGPHQACDALRAEGCEVVCLESPEPFYAVGAWYADFTQVDDNQVQRELAAAAARIRKG